MAQGTFIKGVSSRVQPSPRVGDGVEQTMRVSGYGDQYSLSLVPTKHTLADEGQYFVATNPTIGTGVAHANVTAFSATSGLFVIKNNDASGGKRIYLDYMKLIVTAIATTTAMEDFAFVTDTGNRTPTGGNVAITPVNTNADSSNGTIAVVNAFSAAALTVPAAVSAKTVGRAHIPFATATPGIAGDEYVVQFGAVDMMPSASAPATTRTGPCRMVTNAPPIVLGPQQYLVIHRWSAGETGSSSFEYELAWWER
jgi:hypothetical protein